MRLATSRFFCAPLCPLEVFFGSGACVAANPFKSLGLLNARLFDVLNLLGFFWAVGAHAPKFVRLNLLWTSRGAGVRTCLILVGIAEIGPPLLPAIFGWAVELLMASLTGYKAVPGVTTGLQWGLLGFIESFLGFSTPLSRI